MRSSVVECEGCREALETVCIWTGTRMSDKEGVECRCKDWEKVDTVLQGLVFGEGAHWGVSWRKGEE